MSYYMQKITKILFLETKKETFWNNICQTLFFAANFMWHSHCTCAIYQNFWSWFEKWTNPERYFFVKHDFRFLRTKPQTADVSAAMIGAVGGVELFGCFFLFKFLYKISIKHFTDSNQSLPFKTIDIFMPKYLKRKISTKPSAWMFFSYSLII